MVYQIVCRFAEFKSVVEFGVLILYWVRLGTEFELRSAHFVVISPNFYTEAFLGNSLERIQDYITIEQETQPSKLREPPAYWPASGDLRVENLNARYTPDGPNVLHDVSFHVKAGERVAVVGRSGCGKSSLTLSLLRCIYTEGNVYLDNLLTNEINLDALRSHITIIPQMVSFKNPSNAVAEEIM